MRNYQALIIGYFSKACIAAGDGVIMRKEIVDKKPIFVRRAFTLHSALDYVIDAEQVLYPEVVSPWKDNLGIPPEEDDPIEEQLKYFRAQRDAREEYLEENAKEYGGHLKKVKAERSKFLKAGEIISYGLSTPLEEDDKYVIKVEASRAGELLVSGEVEIFFTDKLFNNA